MLKSSIQLKLNLKIISIIKNGPQDTKYYGITYLENGEELPSVVDVSWALILKQKPETKQ